MVTDILLKKKLEATLKYRRLSIMIFRESSVPWVLRLYKSRSSNRQKTRDG